VATSADGKQLVAAVNNGGVYLAQPPILSAQKINGTMKISWPSLAVGWNLQASDSLLGTNWNPSAEILQDNGTIRSIIVNPTNDSRFYRLANP